MTLKQRQRSTLLVIALLLFIPVALLQGLIDPQRPQYEPGRATTAGAVKGLPIEFALGGLVGFREAIAGLLWVRCDEFFHTGDYDAITPLIRIITWLDPHQVDVYETGSWHMDYNFTDVDQRSDRRYIPLSIALMEEGIKNNDNVPDVYSDLAFTHYFRKIGDFPKAADWYVKGQKVQDDIRAESAKNPGDPDAQQQAKEAAQSVTTLSHMLAHTYEAEGRIEDAMREWQYCATMHQYDLAHGINEKYPEQNGLTRSQRGLYENQMRLKWRARDTKVPVDMQFHPQLVRVSPRIFVLKGTMHAIGNVATVEHLPNGQMRGFLETGQARWAPVDGCRVEIRLNDEGYKMPVLPSFSLSSLHLNPTTTIMQDSASVINHGQIGGKNGRRIDMSQDRDIYSFTAPRYTVTVWFNPSDPYDCPLSVQDRIGWLGEGMTDSDPRVIDTSGLVPGDVSGRIPGLKILKKTFTLTKADIDGQGERVWQ
ncbi:MAG: hypothetical protein JO250_08270 [Armatimonadetes bacterium]|nr:hypothetical protein [Armatimonadota bacterium]